MNNQPVEYRPSRLGQDLLQVVIRDARLYYLYTNALILIHDLICEFAASEERPRFTLDENENHIETILRQLRERSRSDLILHNVEDNYRLAQLIRNSAIAKETRGNEFESERAATVFAQGILQIYTIMRVLRSYNTPPQV
jgi:hypothetical protein